ncbi:50S ribosomal protein L10 [Candidatus Hodgkinia cicadicola]
MLSASRLNRCNKQLAELAKLNTFVIITASAVSCNSVLNLKRLLRPNASRIRFYKNALVRLAFASVYPDISAGIKGQCLFIILGSDAFAEYRLISSFVKANGLDTRYFVFNGSIADVRCVELMARSESEAELKLCLLRKIKRVLFRFVVVLTTPLTSFVNLLNQKQAGG